MSPRLTFQVNLQVDVKVEVHVVLQVRQRLWLLWEVIHSKWHKSLHTNDPRGDGGSQVLGSEGSQGNVLPLLDVTSWREIF